MVQEAPTSADALILAGLDWRVIQKSIETEDGIAISGFRANIRESDDKVLGVVTDRYRVVQNSEAFAFTDSLLGEGVIYETAGALQEGRRTWLLAKLPQRYIIRDKDTERLCEVVAGEYEGFKIRLLQQPADVLWDSCHEILFYARAVSETQ